MDDDNVENVHPNELPFQLSDFFSSTCDGFLPWLSNGFSSLFSFVVVEYFVGRSVTTSFFSSSINVSLGTFESLVNADWSNTAIGIFELSSVWPSISFGVVDVNFLSFFYIFFWFFIF